MSEQASGAVPDFLDDLCQIYRSQEKSKTLQLDMCELMLSSENHASREWILCQPVTDRLKDA